MLERTVSVSRVGGNTLGQVTIPLVFVPGVMGSRLQFPDGERWNPDSKWDMTHWLHINAERERQELRWNRNAQVMSDRPADELATLLRQNTNLQGRGWEGVAWGFYGGVLRGLRDRAFLPYVTPVYAVGYDWRQSNRTSGQAIATRIQQILATHHAKQFILVTHSMGGLATRAMLQESGNLSEKLIGVIHVAQPAVGAVVAYRRFFTGAIKRFQDGDFGLTTILGDTAEKYATIVSGLRGPMELLPTNAYRDIGGTGWITQGGRINSGNVYDLYRNPVSPPGLITHAAFTSAEQTVVRNELMQRLNEAEAFHTWLGNFRHPNTWTIFSTGLDTDMAIVFDATQRDFRGAQPQRRAQGDGTVPSTSAAALFPGQAHPLGTAPSETDRQFSVTGAGHAEVFTNPVIDQVNRIIAFLLGIAN